MGLLQRLPKPDLIGTGTYTQRLTVFWAFAWRAYLCFCVLMYAATAAEAALLGRMTFPEMLKQGHYVRWEVMMLVGAFITYNGPIFAVRWLLRRKYDRRTTWLDAARLWWAFTWRFWPLVFAVRALVLKVVPQLMPTPPRPMLELLAYAISLPLAVWLVGGGMRRLILDEILARYPSIAFNMFCTDCGLQVVTDAAFCSHCGKASRVPAPAGLAIAERGSTRGALAGKVSLLLLGAALVFGIALNIPKIRLYLVHYYAEKGDARAQAELGYMYAIGNGVPQDDQQAVHWSRLAAEQGNAHGQHNLGGDYHEGRGVPQNDAAAANWFRKAAEQGLAEAQSDLGFMYQGGLGVPQNDAEAVKWYRKASDQGIAPAQANLGNAYHEGRGVLQNDAEAANWLRKAADQGFAQAQYNLGVMYRDGRGVPQDYVEAYKWGDLAAKNGTPAAEKLRNDIAIKMTPSQIEKAQLLISKSPSTAYRKAIGPKPDNADAHINLGNALFDKGELDAAIAEYRKAINLKPHVAYAHYNLGLVLSAKGQLDAAIAEYRKAVELKPDYAKAYNSLGYALARRGEPRDAITYIEKSLKIKPDDPDALDSLGFAQAGAGNYSAAVSNYRASLKGEPESAIIHLHLARALEELGKKDDAAMEYKEAYRVDPKLRGTRQLE